MTSLTTSTVQVVVTDNLENQLYDVAKKWIRGEELSAVTLIPLATKLMATAQNKTTKGNGARKKQAVITVITRIIEDFVSEDKQEEIISLVNTLLSPAIDAIVALSSSGVLRKWWKQMLQRCCCA
jgi:hypothetical protein